MVKQRILVAICGIVVLVSAGLVVRAQSGDSPKKAGGNLDQRVAERFRQLDKNNDERLTSEEMGVGLFQQLNSNGDEYVTLDEARTVIRAKGLEAVMKAASQVKNGDARPDAKPTGPAEQAKTESTAAPAESSVRQGPRRVIAGDHGIGSMIPNLQMTDIAGKTHQLSEFAEHRVVVIAFTNTTCPLCKKYAPTLAALEKKFAEHNIAFIYVNSTPTDKTETIQSAIKTHGFAGPYVRDADGSLARAVGATHTTDVFVLDSKRTLIYRGAVDDQYGFGYSLDAPRVEYLDTALRALLENRPLLISATEAPGCPLDLDEVAGKETEPANNVTYHNRISRILQSHCVECHRDGSVAPFALVSYETVVAQSGTIRQAVERAVMPPWFAARPEPGKPSHWANDQSLSDREKSDLLGWLSHGKPAGDPADAPLPKTFPEGWRIGTPNLIVQLPKPMPVKATGVMPYQDVIVETGLTEDKWVRSMEIRPTAKEVVHHVLVFLLPPAKQAGDRSGGEDGDRESDGFFAAYAPGHEGLTFANDFGKLLPARSRLKFQLHYTPNGTAAEDQTQLGIVFAEQKPKYIVQVTGIANPRLSIPPGAENHPETATRTLPFDTTIAAFFPHMHLRGKAFRYEARLPDGRTQLLLDVPRYDFNWQLSYRLAEPIELPRGTTLHLTGWFDNSKNNPANPDPTRTVRWGPQTYDEMMLGYVEYYATDGNETLGRGALGAGRGALLQNLEAIFQKLDRDQDGKLSGDEFPAEWKTRILKLDTDNDGAVSLEEVQRAIRNRPGRSGT